MRGRQRRRTEGPGSQFRRLRKRAAKKQISRRPPCASVASRAFADGEIAAPTREPMRCSFGAVRVGALLGRVRLHLQTDRFLAAHRRDALWEEACREAGLALAELVSRMAEGEMDSPLTAIQGRAHPSESALRDSGQEGWGTRKTGIGTLARCSAELEGRTP